MKQTTLLLAFAAAVLSSCTVTRYFVADEYVLQAVDNSQKESNVQSNTYEDDNIKIAVDFNTNGISVQLTNLANSSLKIIWDDASYIDQFGNAHRVIHTGTKLIDRDKAQVHSVIPKGASLSDEVVPSDCIYWTYGSHYYAGQWKYLPIVQMFRYESREQAEDALKSSADNAPQLLFPIEIGGARYEYTFKFVSKSSAVGSVSEIDYGKTLWGLAGTTIAAIVVELVILAAM